MVNLVLGVVNGGGNGCAIDNLSFSATEAPISVPTLNGVAYSRSGNSAELQISFGYMPGASQQFTVWGAANLDLQFSQWQSSGHPLKVSLGIYQYVDAQGTNKPARFHRVTS